MKEELIKKVTAKLDELGVDYILNKDTDIQIDKDFVDAKWSTGEVKVNYYSLANFNEKEKVLYYYEKTKDIGKGFSYGTSSESSFQTGMTLFRKVKATKYGPEGEVVEYDIDLGSIVKTFKVVAKENGWKFKIVLTKKKALYSKEEKDNNTQFTDNNQEVESIKKTENIIEKDNIIESNNEYNSNEKVVSSNDNVKKYGIKPLIFWIWLVITSILALLVVIVSFTSIIPFVLAIIAIILVIRKRKIIYNNFGKCIPIMAILSIILYMILDSI